MMFKNASSVAESAPVVEPEALIPLSHLALDFGVPPEGWPVYLGRRGIVFRPSIGRDAISAGDAQRLVFERREAELRKQRHLKAVEAEAIERDRQWRASLPRGVPVSAIPEGATYGAVVRQAELDGRPRRRSLLEESLGGDTMVFHSLPSTPDEE
jgi:hypothetical protein